MDHLSVNVRTCTVIFAGYEIGPQSISQVLASNPGLPRRFQLKFVFEDYSEIELRRMYRARVNERGFKLPTKSQCGMNVARVIAARIATGRNQVGFGNCGLVHNKVGQAVQAFIRRKALDRARALTAGVPVDLSHFTTLSKEDVLGKKPVIEKSPILADLDHFVGLHSVKERLRDLMRNQIENWEREEKGEPVSRNSLHAVFVGPPGTGKTEVAKVYAKLLKEWGFLSKGEFMYKTASDFSSNGVVGDATQRAKSILKAAEGCVLMIDEAYALNPKPDPSQPQSGATGGEVVDAIMQSMAIGESADFCLILAGYRDEMDGFFQNPTTNRGFSERVNYSRPWVFEHLDDEGLTEVFKNKCLREGVSCDPKVRKLFIQHMAKQRKVIGFANVRTLELSVASGRAALQVRQSKARAQGLPEPKTIEFTDLVPDAPNLETAHLIFADLVTVPVVQSFVKEVIAQAKVAAQEERDVSSILGDINMCLVGPAGVGKSETARKLAELFYRIGALPKNICVEIVASNFQGRYLGHTQDVVKSYFNKASGGVLFIDEVRRPYATVNTLMLPLTPSCHPTRLTRP
jgi:hypothetical protein